MSGSMQVPLAGPLQGLNWVVPPNFAIAALVSCPGASAGRGNVAFFGYFFRKNLPVSSPGVGTVARSNPVSST